MASGTETFEFYRTGRYTTQEEGDTVDTKHDSEITFPSNTKVTKVSVYVDQGLHSGSGTARDVDVGIEIDCDGWISIYDESIFLSGAGGDGTRDFGTIIIDDVDDQRTIAKNGVEGIRFVQTGGYSVEGKSDLTGTATFYYEDAPQVTTTINSFTVTQENDGTAKFTAKATGKNGSGNISYTVKNGSTVITTFTGSNGSNASSSVNIASKLSYDKAYSFTLTATYSDVPASKTAASKTFYKPSIDAPTVSISASSGQSATLSWTNAQLKNTSGVIRYHLYRNGSVFKEGVTTPYTLTEDVLSQVTGEQTFAIQAVGQSLSNTVAGNTLDVMSNNVSFTYVEPYTAPSTPNNFSVSQTYIKDGDQLTFNWEPSTNGVSNPVTGYIIYKQGTPYLSLDASTTTKTITISSSEFTAGSAYEFHIIAQGEKSNSGTSQIQTVLVYANLAAPTNIQINNSQPQLEERITLTWDSISDGVLNDVEGYRVMYSDNLYGSYVELGSNIDTSFTFSVTSNKFVVGKAYYCKVVTVGSRSDSDMSSSYATFQVIGYSACTAPTVFSLTKTLTNGLPSELFWSGAKDGQYNPINKYVIERAESTDSTNWGSFTAYREESANVTRIEVDPPITDGNYYKYRIQARGTVEDSQYYSDWVESSQVLQNYNTHAVSFTDATIKSGDRVKAIHIIELQNEVNKIREMSNLARFNFTSVESGTGLGGWTSHVEEIRSAINPLYNNSITWIPILKNCPNAAVMEELRSAVRNLDN